MFGVAQSILRSSSAMVALQADGQAIGESQLYCSISSLLMNFKLSINCCFIKNYMKGIFFLSFLKFCSHFFFNQNR